MRKQIIFIHGGETFDTYEEYIEDLKKKEFNPNQEKERQKRWHRSLEKKLGDGFMVIAPIMPCKNNARYKEWKIWFEKVIPYIEDNAVLIGHSLGGIFLVKYLSENDFPKKILATYLVAAPFDDKNSEYSLGGFILPDTLENFEKQVGRIFIYHSEDDSIVPFADVEKYKKALPGAEKIIFKNKDHFIQEEFPELIDNIQKLY